MLVLEKLNKRGQKLKTVDPKLLPSRHMPISFQTKNKGRPVMKMLIKLLMAYSATIPTQTENSHETILTFDQWRKANTPIIF